ncbi:MAG: CHAT domain-containing tetratricopeptide repeat protein [Pyrinomonadaceae bacterium]
MPHVMRRWSLLVIAAHLLSSLALSQYGPRAMPDAFASPDEEVALRVLVEKFFVAYTNKDLDGFMSLWSAKSPDFVSRRRLMQELFDTRNQFRLEKLTIVKTTLEAEKASVRASLVMEAVVSETGKPAPGFGRWTRNLYFVREEGVWKVWREVAAEEDLASALAAAQTKAERETLLAAEQGLLTPELWEALSREGDRHVLLGNYAEAAARFNLTQEIAEQLGDRRGIAAALLGNGTVKRIEGKYAQASEYCRKSLSLSEASGHKAGIANALNELGLVQLAQGDATRALEFHRKSLALREELADRKDIAGSLNNIGISHRRLGDYGLAVEYYQKSFALAEASGNKVLMARTLNNLGAVQSALGDYHLALGYYRRSLPLNEELGNKAGVANTLLNIGLSQRLLGNYGVALEYCLKGLQRSEAIGDKQGVAQALRAIAQTYVSQGNRSLALEYFQKALTLQEEKGDRGEVALLLGSIGNIHQSQGRGELALEHFRRSMALREEIGDRSGVAAVLQSIGFFYGQQGKFDIALEHYRKSLAMREALGGKLGIAEALQKIAGLHSAQGAHAQALAAASRAATLAAGIGHRDTLWQARTVEGKAYRALDRPAEARQAFDEAIAVVESLRAQAGGGEREQQRFFENKVSPYYAMVDLLFEQQKAGEALGYVEAAKARVLLDVLQSGRVNITKAMSPREQEQERTLKGELTSLNTQVARESTRPKSDEAQLSALNTRLGRARVNYEAFQTNLYAAHPELKSQRGEARPVTPEQAGELLNVAGSALLNYLVGVDKTYLLVFTKNGPQSKLDLQAYEIKVGRDELGARTENFRNLLAQRNPDFAEAAGRLYDLLLRPARRQLEGRTNLVIAPDGPLWNLPFQALQPAPARYVIEDQAVAYIPSLTVLREMARLRKRGDNKSLAPTLLAFANPALGQPAAGRVGPLTRDERLAPLPEAEREVKALEQLYGASHSKVYIGAEAREARVKSEAGRYRIIHLATHGILDDASPMYSHLLLSQSAGETAEDGLLEAWELMNLNLRADLVVLSACDTARGHVGAGEGMIGLSWALFVAGTTTTVVSQWKVASSSTAQLMVEFHRHLKSELTLKSKPSEAEALRRAVIKLQADERYRHPFYWAGFVVVGDAF